MKPKRKVNGTVRVRTYSLVDRAVEEGLECGWRRAHKHTDTPEPDAIREAQLMAIMGAICEVIDFDGESA